MFQNFDQHADPTNCAERLAALRVEMALQNLDAFLVPHADEFQSEYLPANAERLSWLTGFTGSAGFAIILKDSAVVFTDGRYTLQLQEQTDISLFGMENLIDNPPSNWLSQNGPSKGRVGFDPWLHTRSEINKFKTAAKDIGAELVSLENNPLDIAWIDQPLPPCEPVRIHDIKFAGITAREKLIGLAVAISDKKADFCVLSDPASIAWAFNIRGADVAHTPLTLARCIVPAEGMPQLFIKKQKLDMETRAYLTQLADLFEPDAILQQLGKLCSGEKTAMLDADLVPYRIIQCIKEAGGNITWAKDPAILPRAVKNQTEIAGSRAAHLRDGAALINFLHWVDQQKPGSIDEITAATRLEAFRETSGSSAQMPLMDISFDTISGAGANGAIVHYRVNTTSNRTLKNGELYLVDSGGQYEDGTTDITRTVTIGEPTVEMRRCFTLVLKGHIALALARFPKGTRGVDIDVLARNALWRAGLDYAHGTGHGIGSYLAVHEGPQNISRRSMQELLPGMIVSNEPGYYKPGEFGIRIENLVLVRGPDEIDGGETPMLGFETLSYAPIDLRLIDPTLLDDDELHWLNAYHGHVRREISVLVEEDVAEWLQQATQPLSRELPAASA